ncbi:MAG: hypothetical protein EBR91_11340 [Flavobacteriia bacterium]|nr:hypothetical protein [Flavobacteriia bacterium]
MPISGSGIKVVILFDGNELVVVPILVVAVTVNVYDVVGVNPAIFIEFVDPVAIIDPGLLVTVYIIGPLSVVDANVIFAVVLLIGVATTDVGVVGKFGEYGLNDVLIVK